MKAFRIILLIAIINTFPGIPLAVVFGEESLRPLSWDEYIEKVEDLNSQFEKGEITGEAYHDQFAELNKKFQTDSRPEGVEQPRPVDALDVEVSTGEKPAQNPEPPDDEGHHH